MTLITFATEQEAECSLQKLCASPITKSLYEYAEGHILITGMGPMRAHQALRRYSCNFDRVINIGIAGALKREIAIDSWHTVMTTSYEGTHIQLGDVGAKLLTLSYPLHDMQKRDRHSLDFDLVDMEGHSIAQFALEKSKPCLLFKLVSDYCTPTTSARIRKRLPEFSEMIATKLTALCHSSSKASPPP